VQVEEPEVIQVLPKAMEGATNSLVVVFTPDLLGSNVEMTTVVILPEGELKECQIYKLVEGRLVECEQVFLGPAQASLCSPPEALETVQPQTNPRSYVEVTRNVFATCLSSTGLEDKLVRLSSNSGETEQSHEAARNRKEMGSQVAAGTLGKEPRNPEVRPK